MRIKTSSLDALFRDYVRMKVYADGQARCERCGHIYYDQVKDDGSIYPAWRHLQCSHFWGRGNHSVRFDEMNVAALCGGCHLYLGANPEEHRRWFINHIGEKEFDLLEARKVMTGKVDKEAVRLYLQMKIKELNGV